MTAALLATLLLGPVLEHRWFYMQTNLFQKEEVTRIKGLLQRASKSGYNGMVLTDTKMQSQAEPPDFYRQNVSQVLEEAKRLKIEVIPVVLPVGYAGSMLANDPSLVEAMPVRKAPFAVKDGKAQIVQDPRTQYRNGGFEISTGDLVSNAAFQDGAEKASFVDRNVVRSGRASLRMESPGQLTETSGNCRVMQRVPVNPWRHYSINAWLKTEGLERPANVKLLALTPEGQPLSFQDVDVKPSMDWTQLHVTFNSQNNPEALIYFGIWDGKGGKIWWDDIEVEELGLMNVVQRNGCPLVVHGAQPGRDYEPVADPRGGNIPWRGEYEIYHASPPISLTRSSRLKEGDRVDVSFYHAMTTDRGKSAICLSEPKAKMVEKREIERIRELFQPASFFLAHDEVRVMNWCQSCQSRKLTPAEILRQDVLEALKSMPKEKVFIWSDMFDPHHNAKNDYYLVNGTLEGIWEGLPTQLTIVNWNQNNAESLRFFAGRGHRQILAGYYDGRVEAIDDWLKKAAPVTGVAGVMYTTWENRYDDLEEFAELAWGRKHH